MSPRRRARLCGVLALLAIGACDRMFRRGDSAEPPPLGWAELGVRPDFSIHTVPTLEEADRICRAAHVAANDEYNKRLIAACVIPSSRELVITATAPPDRLPHEATHTWGLVHHDGKGWFYPDGRQAGALRPEQAQMMLAMARGRVLADAAPRGLMGSSARSVAGPVAGQ